MKLCQYSAVMVLALEWHAGAVLQLLTGIGLATSAGLNAYIPLLVVGLLCRYTDVIDLGGGWGWLTNGWALGALGVLLAIEIVADKVPMVDHVNDVLHTIVRPAAGGMVFGAGTSSTSATVQDPMDLLRDGRWMPIVAGALLAFGVHAVKATARPIINASTFGIGAPIVSTAEDVASVTVSVLAVLFPILAMVALIGVVAAFVGVLRRRRSGRGGRPGATAQAAGG